MYCSGMLLPASQLSACCCMLLHMLVMGVELVLLLLVHMVSHISDEVVQQLMWQLASICSTSLGIASLHSSTL
jgi:hypothetical protein